MRIKFPKREKAIPINEMPDEELKNIFKRAAEPQLTALNKWEANFNEQRDILLEYDAELYKYKFMRYSDYIHELNELRALIPEGGNRIVEIKDRIFYEERLKKWTYSILLSLMVIEDKLKTTKAIDCNKHSKKEWNELIKKAKELLDTGTKPHKLATQLAAIYKDRKPDTIRRKLREANLILGRAKK